MHPRYMRHSRLKERAVACSETFEGNTNHEIDFHERKAAEHREKAKKARKGGLFSGPNEALAKTHDKLAEEHDAKERDPEYHKQEAEYHRKKEREANSRKGYGWGDFARDAVIPGWGIVHAINKGSADLPHKSNAEHHERKAREYQRDDIGRFA